MKVGLPLSGSNVLPFTQTETAGVEDDGNLLGLDAGDLEASLDTLSAMTREVALPSTWTSSQQVIKQYLVCQQLIERLKQLVADDVMSWCRCSGGRLGSGCAADPRRPWPPLCDCARSSSGHAGAVVHRPAHCR